MCGPESIPKFDRGPLFCARPAGKPRCYAPPITMTDRYGTIFFALAGLVFGGAAALSRFGGYAYVPGTPIAHLAYGGLDLVGLAFAVHGLRRRG